MSKKRLEEIKKRLALLHSAVDVDDEYKNYIFKDLKVEWLIEQAERVQELEKEKDEWKYTAQSYYMTNQELREQNKRYREALKFYADDKSWEFDWLDDIRESLIWKDYGEKARKALEGEG